ncbi:MAG TPA: hypothetical protein PK019_17105 [Sedimentisphaerales bacterium]|jgi:hypothetical protein|nr:hypothetical protein [Sedimentisphaerales bacterium]
MSARTVKLSDALRNEIDETLKPPHPDAVILPGRFVGTIVREEVRLP